MAARSSPHRRRSAWIEQATPSPQAGGCLFAGLPVFASAILGLILALIALSLPSPVLSLTSSLETGVNMFRPLRQDFDLQTWEAEHPDFGHTPSQLSAVFMPSVQYWSDLIIAWADETGLDANLIATVMQIESCGDPRAVSSAGASGLMQVMPFHFAGGENAFDPVTNLMRGTSYLRRSYEAFEGDLRFTFAGYNGGITGAGRGENAWSSETRRYVYWGYGIYEEILAGESDSEILAEWLGAGGASLCRQAEDRLNLPR